MHLRKLLGAALIVTLTAGCSEETVTPRHDSTAGHDSAADHDSTAGHDSSADKGAKDLSPDLLAVDAAPKKDAKPSPPVFKTVNGEVVLAAENYTRLGGSVGGVWSKMTTKKGYLGSGYMQAGSLDPSTLKYASTTTRVEYDIDFKQTGTYYVHLRTLAVDLTENGFFATVGGKEVEYGGLPAYYVFVKHPASGWYWYTDGGGAGKRGLKVKFSISSAGVKTFAVCRREKGSRLDHIWLTKNTSTPQDTASLTLPSPSKFLK